MKLTQEQIDLLPDLVNCYADKRGLEDLHVIRHINDSGCIKTKDRILDYYFSTSELIEKLKN